MTEIPDRIVRVVLDFDREEMARRGRRGAAVTHSRHDGHELTRAARSAFLARFSSDDERRQYFADLARRGAAARRTASEGGAQ